MTVKLLPEQHLEFLSLKGGCTGSSESTLVQMPHCWKSHAVAHFRFLFIHWVADQMLVRVTCTWLLTQKIESIYFLLTTKMKIN